jgi:hypothetical protein
MDMAESPVEILRRWEEHGAEWRALSVGEDRAVVELRTCYGERVELLESGDPELLEFLRERA